ncbi:DNA-directed DNA polymerase epsilon, subunit B [Orbilia blumenaviensis]|uniref:DNA polymerase epsilon subunit B n=1 Tax=Orbilia blumenaviensis TaxID=1796055 RepID=A0AAV9VF17_9PEZI
MADSPLIPPSSPTTRERLGGMTIDDEDRTQQQEEPEDDEEEDLYSSHPLPPPRKPAPKTAPIFANWKRKHLSPPPPSSSAVDLSSDPFHPLNSSQFPAPRAREAPPRGQPNRPAAPPRILAVDIPASSLRPLAFRIFTKKHNLTLKSEALALLCSFIGRKCGADWKTSGSAEKLLEEVARTWKRNEGAAAILVDGNDALKAVIRDLEVEGSGANKASLLTRGESFDFAGASGMNTASPGLDDDEGSSQQHQQQSAQMVINSKTGPNLEDINPRDYIHVVDAFSQPKYKYNHSRKQFERAQKPSLLPDASSKAQIFLTRYYLIHHRLLRNPSFQPPTFAPSNSMTSRGTKTYFKITPIAHLLGRSGKPFFIFGLLSTSPDTGQLMLEDPTGSIQLDITHARPIPEDGVWFCPGSFVVVDGTFEADGRFTAYTIGQPPSERRETSAEVFGHMDFLGINMPLEFSAGGGGGRGLRLAEKKLANEGKGRIVVLSEVHLDLPKTHEALTKLFEKWESESNEEDEVEVPAVVVMCGRFVSDGFGVGNGSLGYKEALDTFAVTISAFNTLLTKTTFVLVPSDADPWGAAFTGGASGVLPRKGVPDVFSGKLKRVFTVANPANKKDGGGGKVVLGSNPCRVGYFTREIVVFRDDLGARFSRNAVRFKDLSGADGADEPTHKGKGGTEEEHMDVDGLTGANDVPSTQQEEEEETAPVQNRVPDSVKMARKLVKTVLDQSYLSPYPINIRPVLWDYTHALTLFPLPNYLILADSSTPPFTVTYEGCHVVNPGSFLVADERRKGRFVEFVVGAQAGAGGKVVDFVY